MQDKNILINSMSNLINHISISRKNQQQMFASLSRKDFDKIISNLQDSMQKLRIITVKLLTQLLYNNPYLTGRFCELMNIQYIPNSNIVLNTNLNKLLQRYPRKTLQLFTLLKQNTRVEIQSVGKKMPLLWFINLKKQKIQIQYISRQQLCIGNNFITSKNISFDPLDCVFGVRIVSKNSQQDINSVAVTSSSARTKDTKTNGVAQQQKHVGHSFQNGPSFHMPVSAKNSNFQKPSSRGSPNLSYSFHNYSYSQNMGSAQNASSNINNSFTNYRQSQIKNSNRDNIKISLKSQQHFPNNFTPSQNHHQGYINCIQNHQNSIQQYTHSNSSKKQNNDKLVISSNKNGNRLSLQLNDFRLNHKNNNFDESSYIHLSDSEHVQNTQPSEHHHGIRLITPRQSLRNTQKISIINNGNQTQRSNTQKQAIFTQFSERDKLHQLNVSAMNAQKLKTIHLGKSTKGCQTTRQRKSLRIGH